MLPTLQFCEWSKWEMLIYCSKFLGETTQSAHICMYMDPMRLYYCTICAWRRHMGKNLYSHQTFWLYSLQWQKRINTCSYLPWQAVSLPFLIQQTPFHCWGRPGSEGCLVFTQHLQLHTGQWNHTHFRTKTLPSRHWRQTAWGGDLWTCHLGDIGSHPPDPHNWSLFPTDDRNNMYIS